MGKSRKKKTSQPELMEGILMTSYSTLVVWSVAALLIVIFAVLDALDTSLQWSTYVVRSPSMRESGEVTMSAAQLTILLPSGSSAVDASNSLAIKNLSTGALGPTPGPGKEQLSIELSPVLGASSGPSSPGTIPSSTSGPASSAANSSPSASRQPSSSHNEAPPWFGEIPGSRRQGVDSVLAFRARWQCMTSLETSHWVLDPSPRLLPWPSAPFRQCAERDGFLGMESNKAFRAKNFSAGNWPVAESLKYVWKLKDEQACGDDPPSFSEFDVSTFCAALRRTQGSLFIVGDSISAHTSLSLRSQLEAAGSPVTVLPPTDACAAFKQELKQRDEKGPLRGTWPACERYLICGKSASEGGVELHFSVDEQLRNFNRSTTHPESFQWGPEMIQRNASVVLLNRGAHYREDRVVVSELHELFQAVRSALPQVLIFFRSTPGGHPNCSVYEKPLDKPLTPDMSWPYNWHRYSRQNALAKLLVEGAGGVFLDVEPMTSLRADWHLWGPHKDCLHHCLPGPLDTWMRVFSSMLHDLM